MKVGDQIQVQISGGTTGVTLGNPGGGTMSIGPGASMSVAGVIIEDLGHSWRVRLNMSVDGKNEIVLSKQ